MLSPTPLGGHGDAAASQAAAVDVPRCRLRLCEDMAFLPSLGGGYFRTARGAQGGGLEGPSPAVPQAESPRHFVVDGEYIFQKEPLVYRGCCGAGWVVSFGQAEGTSLPEQPCLEPCAEKSRGAGRRSPQASRGAHSGRGAGLGGA